MDRNRKSLAHYLLPGALLLAGCQSQPATEPEAADRAVVAEAAGVRIASLPQVFEVVINDAERVELAAVAPLTGKVDLILGESRTAGINIVEVVKAELEAFEALPEGRSFGQTQLVAPIGLTYMARGRYLHDGAPMEELRALLVHPWGNRLLTIAYAYPAGEDTAERGEQLMELLGEIEPLDAPVAEAEPTAD